MTIETIIKQHLPAFKDVNFSLPFEVTHRIVKANSVLTGYGEIENKIFLLNEGIVQISILKGEEERILEFVFPGAFFCAYTSFLLQQQSDVQVTTLTGCSISMINKESLLQANQVSLLSNHLSLHIAQQLFLSRARREKDFLILSAEERYKMLLEKGTNIL
jgi:CRP-like cAMP-binding protein